MENKVLRVAIGSTIGHIGETVKNLEQIKQLALKAKSDKVDILLTPEMSATGYGSYDEVLSCAEIAGKGSIYKFLKDVASETGVVLCVGFVECFEKKKYISHYVVYPNGKFIVQRKHRVTPGEKPIDNPYPITSWDDRQNQGQPQTVNFNIFKVNNVNIAIAICADYGIDNLNKILFDLGVELLLVPTGAGGNRQDRFTYEELKNKDGIKRYNQLLNSILPGNSLGDCIKYNRAQAAVNISGYDGRKYYHGGSGSIVNCMGELLNTTPFYAILGRAKMQYAYAEIDINDCLDKR